MGRRRKEPMQNESFMDTQTQSTEPKPSIEDMPLETIRDYRLYNEEARKLNKKLRVCRYPIKQCPIDLHPKQRVKFGVTDGSTQEVAVHVSNHLIHFDQKLKPGQIYDLPQCIVHHLSEKGYPIWGYRNKPDGTKETVKVDQKPRFSLTSVYKEEI